MPNNISLCIEFVAVVVLTRFLTDLVLVRRGAFLFDENAPDTGGVANKKNRAVIQKKPDSGDIEALDFIKWGKDTRDFSRGRNCPFTSFL